MIVFLSSIQTRRLALKPLGRDTVAALAAVERAIAQDRGVPVTDEGVRKRLSCWVAAACPARSSGTWVVFQEDTAIGRVAVDRAAGCGHAWLSYALIPAARGRGLATEAANALLDRVVDSVGGSEVRALVRAHNLPSIALARRLEMATHPDSDSENLVFTMWRLGRSHQTN